MLDFSQYYISTEGVSYLDEIAETLCVDALTYAGEKTRHASGDPAKHLQNPSFFGYFKYSLVAGLAKVLGAAHHHVQAVYWIDPDANTDADDSSVFDITLHMVALVAAATDGLEELITALDGALPLCLNHLPSPALAERTSVLSVSVVTQEELQFNIGNAALLKSSFGAPIQVW